MSVTALPERTVRHIPWHDLFFFTTSSFILGTAIAGLGATPAQVSLLVIFIFVGTYVLPRIRAHKTILFFSLPCLLLGSVYYTLDDRTYYTKRIALEEMRDFEGFVAQAPRERVSGQTATIQLRNDAGRIFIHTDTYPPLAYGDVITVSGKLTPPPTDSYGIYMAKERVHGTVFRPDITILGNVGNPLMRQLLSLRGHIQTKLGTLYTGTQSAFLSGILLGDRDAFTKEFLEKLSISGTMHLTALSGLHMTIIVFAVYIILSTIFYRKKRLQFILAFSIVALFVAMTGFKVSAVRASLMAFLVKLADQNNRLYSPRNAIAFAAMSITLFNPKSVVFDIGFQLSFAATLSIIYLAPALLRFSFFAKESFLNWRNVLAITLAAQIGVFPITVAHFANFSFTSLPANVAILIIMPPLMLLAFASVFFATIFPPLGTILSKPVAFVVEYAVYCIELFARWRIPFNPEIGIVAACIYYAMLISVCLKWSPTLQKKKVVQEIKIRPGRQTKF